MGLIHRIDNTEHFLIDGKTGKLVSEHDRGKLLKGICMIKNIKKHSEISTKKEDFLLNETELKQRAITEIIQANTTYVSYTGRNNRPHTKECISKARDLTLIDAKPIYMPLWEVSIKVITKKYGISFIETQTVNLTQKDDTEICKLCKKNITEKIFSKSRLFCNQCGSITCKSHSKITRLSEIPVCNKCAYHKKFMGSRKYFENQEALIEFEKYYHSLPFYKKMMENINAFIVVIAIIVFLILQLNLL